MKDKLERVYVCEACHHALSAGRDSADIYDPEWFDTEDEWLEECSRWEASVELISHLEPDSSADSLEGYFTCWICSADCLGSVLYAAPSEPEPIRNPDQVRPYTTESGRTHWVTFERYEALSARR